MINTFKLKFGNAPGLPPVKVQTTPVTIFVGPNYSGKSKVLSEIFLFCNRGEKNVVDVILDELAFYSYTPVKAEQVLAKMTLLPLRNEQLHPDHIIVGNKGTRDQIRKDDFVKALTDPNGWPQGFCAYYLRHNILMLDGKGRINLVNSQPAGDLQQIPTTSLQMLFKDDEKRAEVRRIIYDAFGLHFVIDPSNLGQLRIRLSQVTPHDSMQERGIHEEAIRFHAAAIPIEITSDGVKAFTGIITEVIAGDPSVLLIDEPEAFLHPSLAFKLGKEVSQASLATNKRILVSTHSPEFVMGCIQSGAPVNIIRLTYRGGLATARLLSNADILRLMRNPLLRSTGVLSGLFYEFVVVTESDADRAFYQEVNERLLRFAPEWGIPNCLFINAQNKQTVQTIIRPLRELGIPAAGIVDVDILKDGGSIWTNFLQSGFVPIIEHQPLGSLRSAVKEKCDASGKDMKRDGGIDILSVSDREAANNLFDQLASYGLFVVRRGELESWLKHVGASGHGPSWLVDVFEKMGDDPEQNDYVKPSQNDVWAFIGQMRKWFADSNRKGIPL